MKRIKIVLCVLLICLVGCCFSGCGNTSNTKNSDNNAGTASVSSDSEKTDGDGGQEPIKLAVYPLTSPYFEYAISELGIFEDCGANVELVPFAQYTDVIQALDSGSVDAAIMGITETAAPILNDLDLRVVALTDYSYGMDGIVAAKDINSMQDLKGQTIATNVGTMNHWILLNALAEAGMSEKDVNIINMSEGDAAAAFIGGSIKAASIFDPQLSTAVKEGNGKVIYSSKDMEGKIADVLLVKGEIADNRPDEVYGMVKAWFQVIDMYETDPSEILPHIFNNADISEEEFDTYINGIRLASLEYNEKMFSNGGEAINSLIQEVSQFLCDTECLKEVPSEEQIGSAIDSRFIEQLAEEQK